MSPNAPLTDNQRNALAGLRAIFSKSLVTFGSAKSVDERAQQLDPEKLPTDLTVQVEIAPPLPQPPPLLDSNVLKTPERVPIYFYALRDDRADAESELANTRVIFFIHGGGNLSGHPTDPQNIQFYTQILRAVAPYSGDATTTTKCVLIAPSYRLATVLENTFPAALQDLVAAYDYVLSKGYSASNVFIAGESAGGNHALVLTHLVLQSNRSPPGGIVAIAPAGIQAFDRLSEDTKALPDIFDLPTYEKMVRAYLGASGVSPEDPLVSGAFIDFTASWPKTLIFVGTADRQIDAAREVKKRLAALGRPVELVEYNERPHAWWFLSQIFPENIQDAVDKIAQYIFH